MIQRQRVHVNSHKKKYSHKLAKDFMIADNSFFLSWYKQNKLGLMFKSTAWKHTKPFRCLVPTRLFWFHPCLLFGCSVGL